MDKTVKTIPRPLHSNFIQFAYRSVVLTFLDFTLQHRDEDGKRSFLGHEAVLQKTTGAGGGIFLLHHIHADFRLCTPYFLWSSKLLPRLAHPALPCLWCKIKLFVCAAAVICFCLPCVKYKSSPSTSVGTPSWTPEVGVSSLPRHGLQACCSCKAS